MQANSFQSTDLYIQGQKVIHVISTLEQKSYLGSDSRSKKLTSRKSSHAFVCLAPLDSARLDDCFEKPGAGF
jgi:hypothetical protein